MVYDQFLTLDAVSTDILRPRKVGQTRIKVYTDLGIVGTCNITYDLVVAGSNILKERALKPNSSSLSKSSVGLGNVDNASDLNKPISISTQSALNLKANSTDVYTKNAADKLLNGKQAYLNAVLPLRKVANLTTG